MKTSKTKSRVAASRSPRRSRAQTGQRAPTPFRRIPDQDKKGRANSRSLLHCLRFNASTLQRFNAFIVGAWLLVLSSPAFSQGTAFSYQGQLQNNGSLASGTYNFQFSLYTNAIGGAAVAGPITNSAVTVTNGLFTVTMDFGSSVWNGATNWLQIAVETNKSTSFTSLTSRQQITPTPYAIFAESGNAAGLTGTIPMSSLSGTYGGVLSLTNAGNSFTGNGSGLTNLNAVTLGGLSSGNFWQIGGNSGVPAGNNYIGNNDNQYLDIHANGVRVFRLRLLTDGLGLFTNAPNVIGGSSVNLTAPNVVGAVIGGGGGNGTGGTAYGNEVEADFGVIGGGLNNTNDGLASFIGGGGYDGTFFFGNTIYANAATIGGGTGNNIANGGIYGFIGGGEGNLVSTNNGTVPGGADNVASGPDATVGGGEENVASGQSATVAGGGAFIFISGGEFPIFYTIGNTASGNYSAVGGGVGNIAVGAGSFIGGGGYDGANFEGNYVQANAAAIVGGMSNNIPGSGTYSFIGGGISNSITGAGSFIGGGGYDGSSWAGNSINANAATIAGGFGNTIISGSRYAVIGGGQYNTAQTRYTTVAGGGGNTAEAEYGTVAGGQYNTAQGEYSTVAGGYNDVSEGEYSFVGGGIFNFAYGWGSMVPGGSVNEADGDNSFAAGTNANANFNGSFVWSDDTGTYTADTDLNQFVARASGGFFFYTGTGSSGAKLASGATAWTVLCDRNAKKNFQPVDTLAVLNKLAAIPIEQWNYKWEKDTDTPNIGPMAQDFKKAFYPGRDDKGITTLEFDGVELAAIQGLNQKLEEQARQKDTEIAGLKQQNESLEQRLNDLASAVKALQEKTH